MSRTVGEAPVGPPSPAEFRPIGWALAGFGLALRLAGVWAFRSAVPNPEVMANCSSGALLQGVALLIVAARGPVDVAIFISGFDYIRLGMMTPLFGTGSELFLYGLLQPFVAFTFVRWAAWLRAVLVALPLAGFAILHLTYDVPADTGLLSELGLRELATVNGLAFACLSLAIALHALRMTQRAQQRAERLASAQARLVDDMSHELRTPLAILLTAAQSTLQAERSGDTYRRALALVERQARGLGRLVERMLELSDAERRQITIDASDDLLDAVGLVVDDYRPAAAERGVTLALTAAPVTARTDGVALRVVLGNLLANAIRFSPPGADVEIRVSEDAAGRQIAVRDRGPGIAAEDLPHIFERYWRADRARSRRDGSHGLGLALAHRYAELIGATIEVASEPGQGATFTIRWPA